MEDSENLMEDLHLENLRQIEEKSVIADVISSLIGLAEQSAKEFGISCDTFQSYRKSEKGISGCLKISLYPVHHENKHQFWSGALDLLDILGEWNDDFPLLDICLKEVTIINEQGDEAIINLKDIIKDKDKPFATYLLKAERIAIRSDRINAEKINILPKPTNNIIYLDLKTIQNLTVKISEL
jgi:hypothetical protein